MKKLLSISLIILLFGLINSQVDYEEDESNLLVNNQTMKKYEKSLKKLKSIMRMLEVMSDLSDDNSSQDDQPSDQSSEDVQSSEPLETTTPETTPISSTQSTEPITPGNKTESDEASDQSSEEIHSSETTETTETANPEETETETTTPSTTTATTTPVTTILETTPQTYDPLAEPTIPLNIDYPDPPSVHPTYFRPKINRNAFIHIIRYKLFRVEENRNRAKPFLIRFVLLVRFINMSPLAQIRFTLKVIISLSNTLRELQENFKDAPVVCYKSSEFPYEKSVIDTYYICSAEVDSNPLNTESYNDFGFRDNEGNIVEFSASLQAVKAAKSLNEEIQPMREVVSFDNAIIEKGTNDTYNSIIIKGNLRGNKREEVAQQEKLIFTFYEDKGDEINALNSTCEVINHDPKDFQIECYPESFHINGTQQFLSNGTTVVLNTESKNNIEIYLNTTQQSDSLSFYGQPKVKELNRKGNAHFLGYNNYRTRRNPSPLNPLRPILIEFTVFIRFVQYTPFGKVTFTAQLTYRTYRLGLRGLQEEETQINTTAVCEYNSDYYDSSTETGLYNCVAEAPEVPDYVKGFNNFEYYNKDGNPVVPEDEQINFSKDAIEGAKNLSSQVSTYTDIVSFDDAYFYLNENDPNSFFVKGTLAGSKKNIVAQQDSLIMTFYDTISDEEKNGYNTTCEVVNKNPDDFLIKCSPDHNITGDQFLANGTIHDDELGIYLNNTEGNSTFEFRTYGRNANVKWRKNSSGLSGGAIAGIVIACAVALILITILAMFFRRAKMAPTNNSTIVGLKSIDNYNE